MTVLVDDPDFTLHVGDVSDVLRTMPDGSVDCVIELNPEYARLAAERTRQLSLLAEA